MGCLESVSGIVFHFTWCVARGITYKVVLQAVVDPESKRPSFLGAQPCRADRRWTHLHSTDPQSNVGHAGQAPLQSAPLFVDLFPFLGPPRADAFPRALAVLKHRARAVTAQVCQNLQAFVVNVW